MKLRLFICAILLVSAVYPTLLKAAPALDPYTAENFWLLPHTQPVWFEADQNGGFYGETIDGVSFSQSLITNDAGIRLQRFTIGTANIYISDKGVIDAPNDLTAVSMYLALI